jgi:DNA (cytosine-5)-methyltransferase 1
MINGKAISISLFTGAFGLDLGLEKAGFQTVSVSRKRKRCSKNYSSQ